MPRVFAEQPLGRGSRAEQFLFYPVEGRSAHKPNNSVPASVKQLLLRHHPVSSALELLPLQGCGPVV